MAISCQTEVEMARAAVEVALEVEGLVLASIASAVVFLLVVVGEVVERGGAVAAHGLSRCRHAHGVAAAAQSQGGSGAGGGVVTEEGIVDERLVDVCHIDVGRHLPVGHDDIAQRHRRVRMIVLEGLGVGGTQGYAPWPWKTASAGRASG